MPARFTRCAADAGRTSPTVDDYETIALMKKQGHWQTLTPQEQARAVAYLEGPIGRLICALQDAEDAAEEMGGERGLQALAGIRGALTFAERALAEVGKGEEDPTHAHP